MRNVLIGVTLLITFLAPLAQADVVLRLRNADTGHFPAAQQALSDAFFGTSPARLDFGGDGTGVFNGFGGHGATLGLAWRQAWGPAKAGFAEAELELGTARVDFPDGIGVFIDPAKGRIQSRSLLLSLGQGFSVGELADRPLRLDISGGVLAAQFSAHIGSALLDVPATGTRRAGFAKLRLSAPMTQNASGPSSFAEATVYTDAVRTLRFGIEIPFTAGR